MAVVTSGTFPIAIKKIYINGKVTWDFPLVQKLIFVYYDVAAQHVMSGGGNKSRIAYYAWPAFDSPAFDSP